VSEKKQIPHPLKKRGFGMTGLGGWLEGVARSDEKRPASAEAGSLLAGALLACAWHSSAEKENRTLKGKVRGRFGFK
jgi:hypothetical protein